MIISDSGMFGLLMVIYTDNPNVADHSNNIETLDIVVFMT